MARARELGADHVLNYRDDPKWARTLFKLTGRRGVDVVVDNVGRATIADSIKALAQGGRLLTVGNTSGPEVEIDIRYLFVKQISWIERGLKISSSVCRILTPNGLGTGFLISPDLLMTNNHVIPNSTSASQSKAEFNYQAAFDKQISEVLVENRSILGMPIPAL